jgi:hypothetical protein
MIEGWHCGSLSFVANGSSTVTIPKLFTDIDNGNKAHQADCYITSLWHYPLFKYGVTQSFEVYQALRSHTSDNIMVTSLTVNPPFFLELISRWFRGMEVRCKQVRRKQPDVKTEKLTPHKVVWVT